MPRNAETTRRSILTAAIDEFAEYGFAGARIDRIANSAAVNKRMIYVYYGEKEGLFGAALHLVIEAMVHAVPITEDDLPGYAGHLFDYLIGHPEALRMSLWRHLERPDAGPEVRALYVSKIEAIGAMSSSGRIPATDLLVLIQSMASAWLLSPIDLVGALSRDPMSQERLRQHRQSLVEAATALAAT